MPRVTTAPVKQPKSSVTLSDRPRDGQHARRPSGNPISQVDRARSVCLRMEKALATDCVDRLPQISMHSTVHKSDTELEEHENEQVAPKTSSRKPIFRTMKLTDHLRKKSQHAKNGDSIKRSKTGDTQPKPPTETMECDTDIGDTEMDSDFDDALDARNSAENVLRGIVINAVEKGQIPLEEVFDTHLTIDSIKSFFAKFKDCLESYPPITDITKLSDDILQVEFVFARSHFKVKAVEEERLARKTKEKEEMKRAIELFKQKSLTEKDTKKVMKSICETLKSDSQAAFESPSSVPTPSKQQESTEKRATLGLKRLKRTSAPGKQQSTREVDTRATSGSQRGRKGGKKPQLKVEPRGRGSPKYSDYGPVSPPTSESDGMSGTASPELERPVVSHVERILPVRQKPRTPKGRFNNNKSTGLSGEMFAIGVQGGWGSQERSQSPEKKRKGSDGVAIPIDSEGIKYHHR